MKPNLLIVSIAAVVLVSLARSAQAPERAENESPPSMRFDTNAIFGVLEKEKVVVAAAPKESAVPGGK